KSGGENKTLERAPQEDSFKKSERYTSPEQYLY
ncbi:hypothetical protein tpqmel_1013, partial [Candidatus Gastranaerophilus sp. (ex Termes propinquus)]